MPFAAGGNFGSATNIGDRFTADLDKNVVALLSTAHCKAMALNGQAAFQKDAWLANTVRYVPQRMLIHHNANFVLYHNYINLDPYPLEEYRNKLLLPRRVT